MKKLYIASGYNSWTNKELIRAFSSETEADKFLENLTNPHIQVFSYKSTADLANLLLGAK
jgi:hypothetical protein